MSSIRFSFCVSLRAYRALTATSPFDSYQYPSSPHTRHSRLLIFRAHHSNVLSLSFLGHLPSVSGALHHHSDPPVPNSFVQLTNCGTICGLCSPTSPNRSFSGGRGTMVALRPLACPRLPKIRFGLTQPSFPKQPLVEEPHAILPLSLHRERRLCEAEHLLDALDHVKIRTAASRATGPPGGTAHFLNAIAQCHD